MTSTGNLAYEVFVNEPPPQNNGDLPNGEPKGGSPVTSTLIYGSEHAMLTDPAFTADQASVLGDWVAEKDWNLTDIFITHGHGDRWFAAGLFGRTVQGPVSSPPRDRSRRCSSTSLRGRFSGTRCTRASRLRM